MKIKSMEKIKIFIAVFVLILFLLIFYLTSGISPENIAEIKQDVVKTNAVQNSSEEASIPGALKAILEINGARYESEIRGETKVYDFMIKLENEGKISFKSKNYSGMGKLIEDINGTKNNGEENWIYYVNGKKGQIGVSNYIISPGDVVSWKYESNMN